MAVDWTVTEADYVGLPPNSWAAASNVNRHPTRTIRWCGVNWTYSKNRSSVVVVVVVVIVGHRCDNPLGSD